MPILQSLQQILNCQTYLIKQINLTSHHHIQLDKMRYKSFYDGICHKSELFHLFYMSMKYAIPVAPPEKNPIKSGAVLGIVEPTC